GRLILIENGPDGAADGIAVRAGFVRQRVREAIRNVGDGGFSGRGYILHLRVNELLLIPILHGAVGNIVLERVQHLDIADSAGRLGNVTGDSIAAGLADTGWPLHLNPAFAYLFFPLRADLGQVVRPDEGGAARLGAMDHHDVLVRQIHARVDLL